MNRPLRRLGLALTALAGVTALVSCSGAGASDTKDAGFSAAILEPSSLLPANYSEVYGAEVVSALFTPLVTFDITTNEVTLQVAERIETTDNATWSVKLKPGWTFHDGEPVTATSFIDAWNFDVRKTSAQLNAYVFDNIVGYADVSTGKAQAMSGLRRIGDLDFEIKLQHPDSQFEQRLGYPAFAPLPKAAFENPKTFEQRPVGNGPFKMDAPWEHDQQIKLVRNDSYAGSKAKAAAVTYRIYQSFDTAYNDLLAGTVDVLRAIPTARTAEAKKRLGDGFQEAPSGRMEYLGFPINSDKFKSSGVRKAMSMAINRDQIVQAIFSGTRTAATGYVPPVVPGVAKDACGQTCRHDPAAAKAAYQAAGGIPGNGFTIGYNSDAPENKEWVEAVARDISDALGIEVQIKAYPKLSTLLDDLGAGKVDTAFRTAWTFYFPSIENYLKPIFARGAGENFSGYYNPKFEALLLRGSTATSPDAAIAAYNEAEQVVLNDMPYVPLWYQQIIAGHTERVSNVVIDPFRRLRVESVVVN